MDVSVLGGGVMLAITAALWMMYLIPNWLRRREYLASERNAVRLQQTIRALAETAETPEVVRLASLSAAKEAQRALTARPVAVGRGVTLPLPVAEDPRALAARRLRRTRLGATLVVVACLAISIVQLVVGVSLGIGAVDALLAGGSAAGVVLGTLLIARLSRIQTRRSRSVGVSTPAAEVPSALAEAIASPMIDDVEPATSRDRRWTPRPVPKPGYLRYEEALRAARESAAADAPVEASRPAAQAAPAVPATRPAAATDPIAAPARTASRFAAMGVVDVPEAAGVDLDQVLARRRAS